MSLQVYFDMRSRVSRPRPTQGRTDPTVSFLGPRTQPKRHPPVGSDFTVSTPVRGSKLQSTEKVGTHLSGGDVRNSAKREIPYICLHRHSLSGIWGPYCPYFTSPSKTYINLLFSNIRSTSVSVVRSLSVLPGSVSWVVPSSGFTGLETRWTVRHLYDKGLGTFRSVFPGRQTSEGVDTEPLMSRRSLKNLLPKPSRLNPIL